MSTFTIELTTFYYNTNYFEISCSKKNHTADNNVPVVNSVKGCGPTELNILNVKIFQCITYL